MKYTAGDRSTVTKPFFCEVVEIINAEEESGTKRHELSDIVDTIAVRLTFKGKYGFDPEMRFGGDLEFEAGNVVGFGNTGWRVSQLFDELGLFPDGKSFKEIANKPPFIDPKLLEAMKGKKIARLRYAAAWNKEKQRVQYYNLYTIKGVGGHFGYDEQTAMAEVEASFHRGLAKPRPFPTNYRPDLAAKANKSEPVAPTPAKKEYNEDTKVNVYEPPGQPAASPDDDLPF